ncbi:MAG TPA: GNVR domain-containing protein [Vicinamibacterales bacterium]|nr:GNVR domain-containing protein [Vicinamibacterales bacterium]
MLPGKTYSVDDIVRIVRKRIWILLLPLAIISAGTAVVARRMPDTYQSDAMIVVVPQRIPEAYVKSTVTMRIEDRLQAIKAQILSRTQLEQTIKTFNLYARERKAGALTEDIVGRMRNEVFITPTRLGDAFRIGYVGQDPRLVTRVTEYLTTSFINQSLKDRSTLADGTSQFLDTELDAARRQLLEQERKLQEYNQRHSGELPTQQASNLQAIANIQMQIQSVLTTIASLQDRRRAVDKELADIQTMSELFPTDPNPALTPSIPLLPGTGNAAQRLSDARARLAGYQALKYTDDHPDVRTVKRLIAQYEKEVDAEALKQPVSAVTPRPITAAQYAQQKKIESLRDDRESYTKQVAALQAEELRLREQNRTYQFRADMAPTRASELIELTRDYAALNGMYSSLLGKRNESKIAANLEERQIGEQFRLLDPARLPERPTKPNRPLINMMGIAAGLGVGLALVGFLEFRDSTFKTDDEVSAILTLPVLAVVPLMQSDEDRTRATRRRLVMGVGLGGTVLGCLAVLVYTFVR